MASTDTANSPASPATEATKPAPRRAGASTRSRAAAGSAATRRSRASSTRRDGAAQSNATRAKASRTRAKTQAKSAVRESQTATRTGVDVVGDYAERAVLIPVGAALIARERVLSGVNDVITNYSSPAKAQTQLRRFERRGTTARNRLEREVRKTRTRLERELRQRRRELEKRVSVLDERRESVAKNISAQVEQASSQLETRIKDGADIAGRVQERVLSLV